MDTPRDRIKDVLVEDEMRESYIDYAMSVIVSRALPDAKDGLKPVQRRILVAMNDLNLGHSKPFRKSAKITGDVTGNYHPHGTSAAYDTMVRLAQDFSLRYPLVDGQGNFGSIDGDGAAAERYTEARMTRMAEELLADLNKDTVNLRANYDETRKEPVVLPAKAPNLLLNGASGIAVGMATNIPPHNLTEVAGAIKYLINNPEADINALMQFVKGPDFPTGGIIQGMSGIRAAYHTGKGHIIVRARVVIDELKNGKPVIYITEIPYMVNKASMLERIASLVKTGVVIGITDLRDESDRDGMRVVIELRRDAQPQVVLNQLYKHTQMQTTFGANLLALIGNRPKVFTLSELCQAFIDHRFEVITRRTRYDLAQAEAKAHILEGYKIALDNIDEVIRIIRSSKNSEEAKQGLMSSFGLSDKQSQAILDMRLARLTGLERDKIEAEYLVTIKLIEELKAILASSRLIFDIIETDLDDLIDQYGDERRTEIAPVADDIDLEDLIPREDMIITISHRGYAKRVPIDTYRSQRRGGKGLTGAKTNEEDFVEHLFIANTHSYILFFTNMGRCYWLKVYHVPQGSRLSKGRSVQNLIQFQKEERIAAFIQVDEFKDGNFLVLATQKGKIKKTPLGAFSNPRKTGIWAINLEEGDELIGAAMTDGDADIVLSKRMGKAIRFNEAKVRPMGRSAGGVRGVSLESAEDAVVGMVCVNNPKATLFIVTRNGYGKRSRLDDYRITNRGGLGVITLHNIERNGPIVAIKEVSDEDEVMITAESGMIIRLQMAGVSIIGRATQGVKLMDLREDDCVAGVAKIVTSSTEEKETGDSGEPTESPAEAIVVDEQVESDESAESDDV
jgi:DNA gyrase subunit A